MRIRAIVLKKQNTNEYDQLVTFYSQERGKLVAIAKSILKKTSLQSMHLDNLNLVDFELINGRAIPIVASAQSENVFRNIKSSILSLAVANFFVDVFDKLVFENEKDEKLWKFLEELLCDLNNKSNYDRIKIIGYFREKQLQLLQTLGYSPKTDQCSICLTKVGSDCVDGEWALNINLGGLICRNCFLLSNQGVLLKKSDLNILLNAKKEDYPFRSSLDHIFEHMSDKPLKSLDFIYRVVK